jgi:acetyl esterase/lipase
MHTHHRIKTYRRALACSRTLSRVAIVSFVAASVLWGQRTANLTAPAPFDMQLYSGAAPGAPMSAQREVFVPPTAQTPFGLITHVQSPSMRIFLPPPSGSTGAAVVIYPGGGYRVLAIDHEGWQVARWLNSIGVAAIVCSYRVTERSGASYPFPVPLLDARQAVRLTRENATKWGIDPQRIGVLGFSAGGHLASMMLTMFNDTLPSESTAEHGSTRHKPNFGVLIYPVISMHETWAHRGSANSLLGDSASLAVRRLFSTELRVTPGTPPTIVIATQDDDAVPVQNSIAFYQAMTAMKVVGELHVWSRGGHGFGMLASGGAGAREWPERVARWMRVVGMIREKP